MNHSNSNQNLNNQNQGHLLLNAESLYEELLKGIQPLITPQTHLVGIISGGAWLAQRLQKDLNLSTPIGLISSSLHRDDFAQRGLTSAGQTLLPFEVNGADILILDDVLYTGRTLRAVINELFDYGRPNRVRLAVLVDRNGRQLPIEATFSAARIVLPANSKLALAQDENNRLSFHVEHSSNR